LGVVGAIGLAILAGVASSFKSGRELDVRATREDGKVVAFKATARIDTPQEIQYVRHGGILQYVLRKLAGFA